MIAISRNILYVLKIVRVRKFRFYIFGSLIRRCTPYYLQIRHLYITTNPVQNLPTIKGWKTLARDGQKEDHTIKDHARFSCEEGTDAIPHEVLMSHLQDCNSVAEQIKSFSTTMSISSKEVENRKEFCKSLTEILKPYFPEFKLHLFGSSVNGLGFKGSDVDICLQTVFTNEEYVKNIKQVPTLDSVINGEVSADTVACLPPRLLLRFVRRILRKHSSSIHEPIFFIKARCPLLRFYDSKYDVFCDFSTENNTSLCNTKLVRLMCHLDERFSVLTKIIRYWGKYGGFVGDIDLFNSYGFSLLVVYFLQTRIPPVLPPIKYLAEKSEYLIHGDINDDKLLFSDMKKIEPSYNTQTIEELLREYFFHYLTFDFSHVMMPLVSANVPKSNFIPETDGFEFSTITLEDPFRLNNATASAQYRCCRRFMTSLIEACKVYQDEKIWYPNTKKWGICSLFQKILLDPENSIYPSSSHTIKLPLKTDLSLLIRIFQEGLLINCNELKTEGPQPRLRLNCDVYYKTWVGREWIHKNCPSSLTDQLKIENWISNQILKNREDNRKQLLFTFSCECFENASDNELNVILTFNKSKYPPVISIFLKEYIPQMYKKMLLNV